MSQLFKSLPLIAVLIGIAYAQLQQLYVSPELGYAIRYPEHWRLEQTPDGIEISLDDTTNFGIFVVLFTAEEMDHIRQMSLDEVASLMVEGLQQELDGFQVLQSREVRVAGQPGRVIEFGAAHEVTGTPMTGGMYVFLYTNRLYALAYGAENATFLQYQPTFEAMLNSFTLEMGGVLPHAPEGVAPVNPLAGQPNPLARAGANPLAATDPLTGVYSDGQLQLSLQGEGGVYTGEITFNDQTFPLTVGDVISDGASAQLFGSFQSGADRFAFSAYWDGEVMRFETGGANYTLRR